MCSHTSILSHERKVNSDVSLITGRHIGGPHAVNFMTNLLTHLYKVAWNATRNNSETICGTNLRIEEVVKTFVSYNIPSSWPFSLNDFEFISLLRDIKLSAVWMKIIRATISCAFDHNPVCFGEKCVLLPIRGGTSSFVRLRLIQCGIN